MREIFPRQVDKKSRGPQGERGLKFSRRRKNKLFTVSVDQNERLTGRKARGLQIEEIASKRQTFLSLLSGRRTQTSNIFFFSFSIQI